MAINLKMSAGYKWGTIAQFGIPLAKIEEAQSAGVELEFASGTVCITRKGVVHGTVNTPSALMNALKANKLAPTSKIAVRAQLVDALDKAINAHGAANKQVPSPGIAPPGSVPHSPPVKPNMLIMGEAQGVDTTLEVPKPKPPLGPPPKFNKLVGSKPAQAPIQVEEKFPTTNPVKLFGATEMYQPVTASSPGSVYHVFALFEGINLAARLLGGKLSLRAEGAKLTSFAQSLGALGMDMHSGYASAHYTIGEHELVIKTLAACVGSVGFQHVKEVANLEKFLKGQPC